MIFGNASAHKAIEELEFFGQRPGGHTKRSLHVAGVNVVVHHQGQIPRGRGELGQRTILEGARATERADIEREQHGVLPQLEGLEHVGVQRPKATDHLAIEQDLGGASGV